MAGVVAGATEALVSSPFEIVKLRAQVTSASVMPSSIFSLEKGASAPLIARLINGCLFIVNYKAKLYLPIYHVTQVTYLIKN